VTLGPSPVCGERGAEGGVRGHRIEASNGNVTIICKYQQEGYLKIRDRYLRFAIQAAQDKKALDVTLLDLRGIASFTDNFIICSGTSAPQNQAISDEILLKLKHEGRIPNHIEGYRQAEWILMDYSDFIVHIFSPKTRAFYNLERLWREAPRTEITEAV
jgi:ribosome-associated protein